MAREGGEGKEETGVMDSFVGGACLAAKVVSSGETCTCTSRDAVHRGVAAAAADASITCTAAETSVRVDDQVKGMCSAALHLGCARA